MIQYDVCLKPYNTFRVNKRAKIFAVANNINELEEYTSLYPNYYLLGNGSNILIIDDIPCVIKLGKSFPAATKLSKYCSEWLRSGISGLEPLAGIPGTLGGAVYMNAGGRHGSIGDIIESVIIFNQAIKTVKPIFKYRSSNIKGVILDCKFKEPKLESKYLIAKRIQNVIQNKIKSQPLRSNTAGCIFKNPAGHNAGKLISQCSIRLPSGIYISQQHANFLEVEDGIEPQKILETILRIQNEVKRVYDIELETEVQIWSSTFIPNNN